MNLYQDVTVLFKQSIQVKGKKSGCFLRLHFSEFAKISLKKLQNKNQKNNRKHLKILLVRIFGMGRNSM